MSTVRCADGLTFQSLFYDRVMVFLWVDRPHEVVFPPHWRDVTTQSYEKIVEYIERFFLPRGVRESH